MTFSTSQRHRIRTHSHTTRTTDDDNTRHAASSNHPTRDHPFAVQAQPLDLDTEPDIIIQHRDGGVAPDEPPPYLDGLQAPPPSSIPLRDTFSEADNPDPTVIAASNPEI